MNEIQLQFKVGDLVKHPDGDRGIVLGVAVTQPQAAANIRVYWFGDQIYITHRPLLPNPTVQILSRGHSNE